MNTTAVASLELSEQENCPSSYSLADRPTSLLFMITAFISSAACYVTIRECVADFRSNKFSDRALPMLIGSLNVGYFVYNFAKIFGPIPAPQFLSSDGCVWGAFGTVQTCEAQSFFIQLGVWSLAFHLVALVSFYVLVVKYNWREKRLRKAAIRVTTTIWCVCLSMAVAGLVLDVYNFKDQNCYIGVFPPGCRHKGDCIRGGKAAYVFGWIVKSPYIGVVAVMSVLFFVVFAEVRKLENKISRYGNRRISILSQQHQRTHVQRTRRRSLTAIDRCAGLVRRDKENDTGRLSGVSVLSSISAASLQGFEVRDSEETATSSMHCTGAGGRRASRIRINREKSKAVAVQAIILSGYTIFTVVLVMFEMFAPLFLGYKHYGLHLVKVVVDNLQGFNFFFIFARPRNESMMTPEGRVLRSIVFCTGLRKWCVSVPPGEKKGRKGTGATLTPGNEVEAEADFPEANCEGTANQTVAPRGG